MIKNQAQAQTQRKKSSPDIIPHDIPNRPNSRGKFNNLRVIYKSSPGICLNLPPKELHRCITKN
jgi:hypothetical protein